MTDGLPSPMQPDSGPEGGWAREIIPIVATAHSVWSQPGERRRMRAYGFRPAVEDGVLKREWHQLSVRAGPDDVRARHPRHGELRFVAETGELTMNGRPFEGGPAALETAELLVSLINDYERWVEVREGRASRLRRTASVSSDRRPVNAIAETRRLQRLLGSAWGRPPTRRR
jgi:hypothetical protein